MKNAVRASAALALFLSCGLAVADQASLSGSNIVLNGTTLATTQGPVSNLRTIAMPGTPGVAVTWTEGGQSFVSFSNDGATFSRAIEFTSDINLRFARFDPVTRGEPGIPADLQAREGTTARVVLLAAPLMETMLPALNALGVQVHGSIPDAGLIATVPNASLDALKALPFVAWVGAYQPAYKLDNFVGNAFFTAADGAAEELAYHHPAIDFSAFAAGGAGIFNLRVLEPGAAYTVPAQQAVLMAGGRVLDFHAEGQNLRVELTREQLAQVLKADQVLYVDPWGMGGTDTGLARALGGGDYLFGLNFRGQGVRGEVMDSEVRIGHQEFLSPAPVLHGAGTPGGFHGSATYGIVFASGVNAASRGFAPNAEAKIYALYFGLSGFGGTGNRYNLAQELVNPALNWRAVFQSNSWGSPQTTQYTTVSAEMDRIIYDTDLLILNSQSNTNNQNSRPEAWAKNVVGVGALNGQNTLTRADDTWGGASIGPAADGRLKPDLSNLYDLVTAPSNSSNTAYTTSFGGTSAATPITAGHFALLFQMWHQGVFPGFGGGSTVFDSRPRNATARALMINTAFRYAFSGATANLARRSQGWGFPDLRPLYDNRNNFFIVNQQFPINQGQSRRWQFTVPAGTPEFRVTMVYRDPQGAVSPAIARVNDISVRVTGPTGTVWWGNNGLNAGNVSTSGGSRNSLDTVENVFLVSPPAGVYTVDVFGDIITADTLPSIPGINANYSLVVFPGTIFNPPVCRPDFNGDSELTFDDIQLFVAAYNAQQASADFNNDGEWTFDDIQLFVSAYNAGC